MTEIKQLEAYHRKNLHFIQHIPQSTAFPAIYLLTGIAQIEAQLHVKVLSLYPNIAVWESKSPPATFIKELIILQLATKESDSIWNYPDSTQEETLERNSGPSHSCHWTIKQQDKVRLKSSLDFLNIEECKINQQQLHPVCQETNSPLDSQKAMIKVQLLT